MMTPAYDVFISYKHTDAEGLVTRDSAIAAELHQLLTARGIRVFCSSTTLEQLGTAAYKAAIDTALDSSSVLIAVGTSAAHLTAHWVQYEWDGFYHDILNGIKPNGRLFSFIEGMAITELPRTLRQNQVFRHPHEMERLAHFIEQRLDRTNVPQAQTPVIVPQHNLPQPVTSFVGRETELENIAQLLHTTRLLTLTGAGGIGKTRLALYAAERMLGKYPDGVWLVELAALYTPELVVQNCAMALGISLKSSLSIEETLLAALRERRLLLVLDNCEHLIEACAVLADTLMHMCPDIQILATSREPLRIAGEVTLRVPSLVVPDVAGRDIDMTALLQVPSIRLFIERVMVALPHFRVNAAMAPALTQICRQLDGIPLALELAAARVRALSLDDIASRLTDRFHLLTNGGRTALTRHQTLRAMVEWSHNLLTPPEQVLLRRLSVFAGGWSLAAAEAICADDSIHSDAILDILTSLIDKSMVLVENCDEGCIRYRMLETFRQFAAEKLEEVGELFAIRKKHIQYYQQRVSSATNLLEGRPKRIADCSSIFFAVDNVRAALTNGAMGLDAVPLAIYLMGFSYSECYMWLKQILEHDTESINAIRGRALMFLAMVSPKLEEALQALEESIVILRNSDLTWLLCEALRGASTRYIQVGNTSRAREYISECNEIARVSHDRRALYTALGAEAELLSLTRDRERLQSILLERLAIAESLGDQVLVGWGKLALAEYAYISRGEYTVAHQLIDECLAADGIFSHDVMAILAVQRLRGHIFAAERQVREARAAYLTCMTGLWELGHNAVNHLILLHTGALAVITEHFRFALRLLAASERVREMIGVRADIPINAHHFDPALTACKSTLDAAEFDATWAAGAAMTTEDALAECKHYLETGEPPT